jgi:hypothetical protein
MGLISPSLSFSSTSAVKLIVQSASSSDAFTVFESPEPSISIPCPSTSNFIEPPIGDALEAFFLELGNHVF